MQHVFIMDPLDAVKPWKDTTYHLMLAAAERGHQVHATSQAELSLRQDKLYARTRPLQVYDDHQRPFGVGDVTVTDLASMDVVWERTDPPVNRRYLYASLFLDFLPDRVRVINRPAAIRDWNEKLAALMFPQLTPATLVSSREDEIREFIDRYERATVKPVDGHGGKGIRFCDRHTPDLTALIASATGNGKRWTIVQEYLPRAAEGDKRILMLDGEILGAILRLHAEGKELNNLDQGGTANATTVTERDRQICAAVGPALHDAGIVFAGIDVIGDMLVEVNVTSPTGLQEATRFSQRALHHEIIERLEGSAGA